MAEIIHQMFLKESLLLTTPAWDYCVYIDHCYTQDRLMTNVCQNEAAHGSTVALDCYIHWHSKNVTNSTLVCLFFFTKGIMWLVNVILETYHIESLCSHYLTFLTFFHNMKSPKLRSFRLTNLLKFKHLCNNSPLKELILSVCFTPYF